jgi:uncharacterized repeat protein (TIGR03803 family)
MSRFLSLYFVLLAASGAVSAQEYTVLQELGSPGNPGGLWVDAGIAQSRGGRLFITSGLGTPAAFAVGTDSSYQVLHNFGSASAPLTGVILATDGNYYGVSRESGAHKLGFAFRMTKDGDVKVLHNFTGGSDGAQPWAIMQSVEGDFYVTTEGDGGAAGDPAGSILRMTADGDMTLLHAFSGSDGASPMILVQGTDFRFYGVTTNGGAYGGTSGYGTIFRISSTGDFELLHSFDNTDGAIPQAGLTAANDGNFYGTTYEGGAGGTGTLFRMTPSGEFTVLHDFVDGPAADPQGRMVQASDGNLYGALLVGGGGAGYGLIFRATLDGVVTPIQNFTAAGGFDADSALIQHTNGELYGGTQVGGKYNAGTIYSLDLGLPPFVSYLPTYGRAGAEVEILGQGFGNSTEVFFNGKRAARTIVNPTFIEATVPSGASTGPITVTTENGTLASNIVFIVHPN